MNNLQRVMLWFLTLFAGFVVSVVVLLHVMPQQAAVRAGNFNVSGGGTYRLYSSVGSSNTSITLSSFKEPVSNTLYTMSYINTDIGYGTLDPNSSTISEFVSFTGITQNSNGTATLTGVVRGLARTPGTGGCVASTTLAQPHSGQAIFILSNSPCFQGEYVPLRTNSTSSAIQVFASTSPPRYDNVGVQKNGTYIATTSEFASFALVAAVANAGTVNATEAVKGIVEGATQIEMASSTATGGTGAGLFVQAKYATSSFSHLCMLCVPVTQNDGTIAPFALATSSGYTYNWAASSTFSGVLNLTGTLNIIANSLTNAGLYINGLSLKFPTSRPTATTTYAVDATGNVTYYRPDFFLLASTTLSSGIASTTLTIGATSTDLRVVIDVPATAFAAGDNFSIQFNGDTGNNYSWSSISQAAAATNGTATQVIRLAGNPGAATYAFVSHIDIVNDLGRGKTVTFKSAEASASVAGSAVGEGFWNNTTQVINTITFGAQTQIPAGTRISVYGSNQ